MLLNPCEQWGKKVSGRAWLLVNAKAILAWSYIVWPLEQDLMLLVVCSLLVLLYVFVGECDCWYHGWQCQTTWVRLITSCKSTTDVAKSQMSLFSKKGQFSRSFVTEFRRITPEEKDTFISFYITFHKSFFFLLFAVDVFLHSARKQTKNKSEIFVYKNKAFQRWEKWLKQAMNILL